MGTCHHSFFSFFPSLFALYIHYYSFKTHLYFTFFFFFFLYLILSVFPAPWNLPHAVSATCVSVDRPDRRTVGRSVWSLLLVCLRSVSSVSHYAAVRLRRTVLQPCCVSASELWPFRLLQCTLDWICLRKFLRRDWETIGSHMRLAGKWAKPPANWNRGEVRVSAHFSLHVSYNTTFLSFILLFTSIDCLEFTAVFSFDRKYR